MGSIPAACEACMNRYIGFHSTSPINCALYGGIRNASCPKKLFINSMEDDDIKKSSKLTHIDERTNYTGRYKLQPIKFIMGIGNRRDPETHIKKYIPFMGGRPKRDQVINNDDVLNLTITLNTAKNFKKLIETI